jgi:hypothetical protein
MYMNFGGWILFSKEKLTDSSTISSAAKYISLVVEVCVHARGTEFAANSRSIVKMGVKVK